MAVYRARETALLNFERRRERIYKFIVNLARRRGKCTLDDIRFSKFLLDLEGSPRLSRPGQTRANEGLLFG